MSSYPWDVKLPSSTCWILSLILSCSFLWWAISRASSRFEAAIVLKILISMKAFCPLVQNPANLGGSLSNALSSCAVRKVALIESSSGVRRGLMLGWCARHSSCDVSCKWSRLCVAQSWPRQTGYWPLSPTQTLFSAMYSFLYSSVPMTTPKCLCPSLVMKVSSALSRSVRVLQ